MVIIVMFAGHAMAFATALTHTLLHLPEALGDEIKFFFAHSTIAIDVHDREHPFKAGAFIAHRLHFIRLNKTILVGVKPGDHLSRHRGDPVLHLREHHLGHFVGAKATVAIGVGRGEMIRRPRGELIQGQLPVTVRIKVGKGNLRHSLATGHSHATHVAFALPGSECNRTKQGCRNCCQNQNLFHFSSFRFSGCDRLLLPSSPLIRMASQVPSRRKQFYSAVRDMGPQGQRFLFLCGAGRRIWRLHAAVYCKPMSFTPDDRPAHSHDETDERPMRPAMLRGLRRRCPSCGEGMMFKGYLKVADRCPVCREDLSQHRADDGPAYLTILIVGHLMAPTILWFFTTFRPDPLVTVTVFTVGCVALSLYLLPRLKGMIVGIQWAKRMHGFGKDA